MTIVIKLVILDSLHIHIMCVCTYNDIYVTMLAYYCSSKMGVANQDKVHNKLVVRRLSWGRFLLFTACNRYLFLYYRQ